MGLYDPRLRALEAPTPFSAWGTWLYYFFGLLRLAGSGSACVPALLVSKYQNHSRMHQQHTEFEFFFLGGIP